MKKIWEGSICALVDQQDEEDGLASIDEDNDARRCFAPRKTVRALAS